MFVQASEHFLEKLFLFLHKVTQVIPMERQASGEYRIGQTPRGFRHESRMAGYGRQMRFDGSPEFLVLLSELDVVIKDLLFLLRCEIVNVDHNLTLAEKRESPFL